MKLLHEWDFVTKYYPNYDSSSTITENDDLHKICDGEINGYAETMYNEKIEDLKIFWGGCMSADELEAEALKYFEALRNESDADIFRDSINAFIEIENAPVTFARKCSHTGEGMNEGFVVGDGDFYFSKKSYLKNFILKKTDYKSLKEAFKDEYYYYTDWNGQGDDQYIMIDGVLTEIEE